MNVSRRSMQSEEAEVLSETKNLSSKKIRNISTRFSVEIDIFSPFV
jgi:hypothetical protein